MDKRKIIEMIADVVGENHGKIVKTIPASDEHKKKWKELNKLREEAELAVNKHGAYKKAFWSSVEIEFNEYRHIHFNEKIGEFEVYDNSDNSDGESIASPFIR